MLILFPGLTVLGQTVTGDPVKKVIKVAFENTINMFDTGEGYNKGQPELEMRRVIKELGLKRTDLILLMKLFWGLRGGPNNGGLSHKHIVEGAKESLERLGTDYVDVIFAHRHAPTRHAPAHHAPARHAPARHAPARPPARLPSCLTSALAPALPPCAHSLTMRPLAYHAPAHLLTRSPRVCTPAHHVPARLPTTRLSARYAPVCPLRACLPATRLSARYAPVCPLRACLPATRLSARYAPVCAKS